MSPTVPSTLPQEEVFAYTVTVGKKTSAAQSYVEDPAAVMDVLSTLIKSAQRDRRTSSACDLATMSLGSQVSVICRTELHSFRELELHRNAKR